MDWQQRTPKGVHAGAQCFRSLLLEGPLLSAPPPPEICPDTLLALGVGRGA